MILPEVKQDLCTGCGMCVAMMPEVFKMRVEDGIERSYRWLKDSCMDEIGMDEITAVMDECPTEAIVWANLTGVNLTRAKEVEK